MKNYLDSVSIIVILLGVLVGVKLTQKPQDIRKRAQEPAETSPAHPLLLGDPMFANYQNKNSEYKEGELIIKFLPKSTESIEAGFSNSLMLTNPSRKDIATMENQVLIDLHSNHTIESIEAAFPTIKKKILENGSDFSLLVNSIQDKFPQRTARIKTKSTPPDLSNIFKIKISDKEVNIKSICDQYKEIHPDIVYCTPNHIARITLTPNDPYFHSSGSWYQDHDDLWGLKKISSEKGWDITTDSPAVVGVIDTGLDYSHPEIQGVTWSNLGEDINGDGVLDDSDVNGFDDDGNGYSDDFHGWDFVNQDNDATDDNGHGTHVSGTIAARGNNSLGIAGVVWDGTVMPIKSLDFEGAGTSIDLANAIVYAADNGVDVLNNSWGGYGSDQLVIDALNYAYSQGVIIVASAGNEYLELTDDHYPGGLDNVLTVSATDHTDKKAHYSNWGELVDVAAPGSAILSLKAFGTDIGYPLDNEYTVVDGTSMASPHVAGLAALILETYPNDSSEEIIARIIGTADEIQTVTYIGSGRINVHQALTSSPRPNIIIFESETSEYYGNGNGHPDPGETVNIILRLKNTWLDAENITTTMEVSDPYVSLISDSAEFGRIAQYQSVANSSNPFTIHIDENTPLGHKVYLTLNITDNNGYSTQRTLPFSITPFEQITTGELTGKRSLSYSASWSDYDNDGDNDVYIPNWDVENLVPNKLFENNGDGTFSERLEGNLVTDIGNSLSSGWIDYNNDKLLDLFVSNHKTNYHPNSTNVIYQNNGDGTFSKPSMGSITEIDSQHGSWADVNNDGWVDLFLISSTSYGGNSLHLNNEGVEFIKVPPETTPLSGHHVYSGSWADYDNDGDPDLFVANDSRYEPSHLYQNNGYGFFTEVLIDFFSELGNSYAAGSWADYDNDGYLDLLITSGFLNNNILLHNEGDGTFTNATDSAITESKGLSSTWGDFDNDGDLDVFTDNLLFVGLNTLYRNDGDGSFEALTDIVPINNSAGSSWVDYNNDGSLDLFVSNYGPEDYLFKNLGNNNHWINISLSGTKSNAMAIGARIKAKAEINDQSSWQIREIASFSGIGGQDSPNVEFGFGKTSIIDELIIEWPSGLVTTLYNLPTDQFLNINEDENTDCYFADLNCDCRVNDTDVSIISDHFSCRKGEVCYTSKYDVAPENNPDGVINTSDVSRVAAASGWVCSEPTITPTPTDTTCTPANGDTNGDGKATPNDYSVWAFYFDPYILNNAGSRNGDFNCSRYVDGTDFSIWSYYFTPF